MTELVKLNLIVAFISACGICLFGDFMGYLVGDGFITFICVFFGCFVLRWIVWQASAGAIVGGLLVAFAPGTKFWEWILGFIAGGVIDWIAALIVTAVLFKCLKW